MAKHPQHSASLQCTLLGVGAWGPGFACWPELQALLSQDADTAALPAAVAPKPSVIPANERRRAPLPVKAAVEVSSQALAQSGLAAADVACVFGSGLGDTEITDYMCRVLASEQKQLSPTKFHNSVHNAAAGYWTISSGCMKSANSIAGYLDTAGLALLEGITLCTLQQEPVLVTLFDTAACAAYQQMFAGENSFAAALVLSPDPSAPGLANITMELQATAAAPAVLPHPELEGLRRDNPSAQLLGLLLPLAQPCAHAVSEVELATGTNSCIRLQLQSVTP